MIQIVLVGQIGEESIAELCRHEGTAQSLSWADACGRTTLSNYIKLATPQPSPGAGFRDEHPEGLRPKPVVKGKYVRRNHLAEGMAVRRNGKFLSQKAKLFVAHRE